MLAAALGSDPAPLASRRFGDYKLESEIARGGMGVVYRGKQLSLKRTVAVKMLLAGELASSELVQRFYIEAEAAAKLNHPNIVPVYDVGEWENEHYLVMEFVNGGKLTYDPNRDAKTTADIIAKVAWALAYAHEHGVLHRDLKPSNILIDDAGEPKLTDFGLAKITANDSNLTATEATIGSPGYMSPEQASQGEVTTASDVYGLGAVLYEMLAGHAPFRGKTLVDTLHRVVTHPPRPLPVSVHKDIATICMKCLSKHPSGRYATARELAEDCQRFARGEMISARPVPRLEHLYRLALRHPKSAALVTASILSILLGITGVFLQWQKAERATEQQARLVKHLQWQTITEWLDDDEASRALAYLASEIREDPDHWQAVMYAMSIVDQNSFPVSGGPLIHPSSPLTVPAVIAPSGEWVAGASAEPAIRVWEASTGREIAHFQLDSPVVALATGTGASLLVFSTADGNLHKVADLEGLPVKLPRTATDPINRLAISGSGELVLAQTNQHVEAHQGASTTQILTLDGGIVSTALSRNGDRILAWNKQVAKVWDAKSGEECLTLQAESAFRGGDISHQGTRVVLLDGANICRSWDVQTGKEFPRLEQALNHWNFVSINSAGTRATAAGAAHELTLYDIESGLVVAPPMPHHYSIKSLVASNDGQRLASMAADGVMRLWDSSTGEPLVSPIWIWKALQDPSIGLSANGDTMLVHTPQFQDIPEALGVWRLSHGTKPIRRELKGKRNFDLCRLSPDEKYGCVGLLPNPEALVFDLVSGQEILRRPTAGGVYDLQFSPDGQRVYALTNNGWFYGWNLKTGQALWTPEKQPGAVRPGAISPDGSRVIAGHNDGHIRIYDTNSGRVVMTLDHPGEIKSLRFAPDDSGRFVSSGTDHMTHVWDLRTGTKLQTFGGHTHTVLSTAWSRDSRYIATASYDSTAKVWNVRTGQMVGQPLLHATWLSHLEFSPDGKTLATACRDGTARLWNPFTGESLSEPIAVGEACEAVRFSADGKVLMARDVKGFRFFDAKDGEAVSQFYQEPEASSIGIDSVTVRSFMNKDATKIFLAASMDDAAYWSVAQPRDRAPIWLPDFLETLALTKHDVQGNVDLVPGWRLKEVQRQISLSPPDNPYALWAKRVLGTK